MPAVVVNWSTEQTALNRPGVVQKKPAAHPVQAELSVVIANWPPGQAVHVVEAAWPEKYPAIQPVQSELPDVVVNWPPGHDMQTVFAEIMHAAEM